MMIAQDLIALPHGYYAATHQFKKCRIRISRNLGGILAYSYWADTYDNSKYSSHGDTELRLYWALTSGMLILVSLARMEDLPRRFSVALIACPTSQPCTRRSTLSRADMNFFFLQTITYGCGLPVMSVACS